VSRKRHRSAKQLTSPPDPQTPVSATRAQKEAQLLALAMELDVVLMPVQRLVKQLGHAMLSRMCAREGLNVYQTMDFTLPNFPLSAARKIFSPTMMQMEKGTAVWRWMTFPAVATMFGPLFQECDFVCAGPTRALRTESEPVIRVLATLLPGVQISHTGRGEIDRLHVTAMYVLADEEGEIHPPKDGNRREVSMSTETQTELRQQLFTDASQLAEAGAPLSPAFLRHVGLESKALEAEALLHNRSLQNAIAQAGGQRQRSNRWEVARILEYRRGKSLVEWAGYHPSWEAWRGGRGEAGSAISTWEPNRLLKNTEAWATYWEQANNVAVNTA